MKIFKQKHGEFTKSDAANLASLLIRAGYTVSIRMEKPEGGTTRICTVVFHGDEGEA